MMFSSRDHVVTAAFWNRSPRRAMAPLIQP